ncbi:MAG TPA: hypothetical protein VGI74_15575 [Streptosporangiaceae bacterium]
MTEPPVATRADEGTQPPDGTPPAAPAVKATPARRWRSRAITAVREHKLLSILVAAGLVLRVLAQIAYLPALIYVDTFKYLYNNAPGSDPLGYRYLLKAFLVAGNVTTVAAVQHLLGLAMAITLYLVLVRRGTAKWLAALAVAPVLLDAYQLQMEQTIMPDVWFEALVVAGLAVLLWRPVVSIPFAVVAGLILGSSATFRQMGELLALPVLLFLLTAGGGWRVAVKRSAALVVAFLIPILGYSSVSYVRTHHFWLARGQSSIGRTTAAADCATLKVPADVRSLCPSPAAQAHGPDFLEHSGKSPLYSTPIPVGTHRPFLLEDLNSAIKHQQLPRVGAAILRDSVRLFALTRDGAESVTPISRWQFQAFYPSYPPFVNLRNGYVVVGKQPVAFGPFRFVRFNPSYGGKTHVIKPVASFLRAYQLDGGYTPGPLFLICLLVGLAGSLFSLIKWRTDPRTRGFALGCLLFTGCASVLLLVPDVFEFSWRYELPAVIVLPMAGVLGINALLSWRRSRKSGPAQATAA